MSYRKASGGTVYGKYIVDFAILFRPVELTAGKFESEITEWSEALPKEQFNSRRRETAGM
jgi:hypothetical protein